MVLFWKFINFFDLRTNVISKRHRNSSMSNRCISECAHFVRTGTKFSMQFCIVCWSLSLESRDCLQLPGIIITWLYNSGDKLSNQNKMDSGNKTHCCCSQKIYQLGSFSSGTIDSVFVTELGGGPRYHWLTRWVDMLLGLGVRLHKDRRPHLTENFFSERKAAETSASNEPAKRSAAGRRRANPSGFVLASMNMLTKVPFSLAHAELLHWLSFWSFWKVVVSTYWKFH